MKFQVIRISLVHLSQKMRVNVLTIYFILEKRTYNRRSSRLIGSVFRSELALYLKFITKTQKYHCIPGYAIYLHLY